MDSYVPCDISGISRRRFNARFHSRVRMSKLHYGSSPGSACPHFAKFGILESSGTGGHVVRRIFRRYGKCSPPPPPQYKFAKGLLNKLIHYGYAEGRAFLHDMDRDYTYVDLVEKILYFLDALRCIVAKTKCRTVAIVGDYSLECIALFLACYEKNLVVVPLLKGSDIQNYLTEGNVDVVFRDGRFLSSPDQDGRVASDLMRRLGNHAGLVIFTSGTTGKPKAVLHDLDNYVGNIKSKRSKKISMVLMLMFDHVGGINTILRALFMGASCVVVHDRKDVDHIAGLIEKYRVKLLPTNPTMLNLMLIGDVNNRFDLSSLRIITYGTEIMSQSLLNRLRDVFKHVRFIQVFGTSEVGILDSRGDGLHIQLPEGSYKVIDNELLIKSDTLSLGYLNFDNYALEDGYFRTGDLVEVSHKGGEEFIRVIGRVRELINVAGEKVLPVEVEDSIMQLSFISDCVVTGEKNAITGQTIVAKVVLNPDKLHDLDPKFEPVSDANVKRAIRNHLKGKLSDFKIPTRVSVCNQLPYSSRHKKLR